MPLYKMCVNPRSLFIPRLSLIQLSLFPHRLPISHFSGKLLKPFLQNFYRLYVFSTHHHYYIYFCLCLLTAKDYSCLLSVREHWSLYFLFVKSLFPSPVRQGIFPSLTHAATQHNLRVTGNHFCFCVRPTV